MPAIQNAIKGKCNVIFLLSDGEFGPGAPDAIVRSNRNSIPIHTVSMGIDSATLKEIAMRSGGQYRAK